MTGVRIQAALVLLLSLAVAALAAMSVIAKTGAPASPTGDEVPLAARLLREATILMGALCGVLSAVRAWQGEQKYARALPVLLPLLGVLLGISVMNG